MFGGAEALEIKMLVEKRLDKIEEMLKIAVPEIAADKGKLKKYTEEKIEEIGCKNLPISEIYNNEQWDMLNSIAREECITAVFHALCIGFANGVKWERK